MSVDLYIFRPGMNVSADELHAAVATLGPAMELARGSLLLWRRRTVDLMLASGGIDSDEDPNDPAVAVHAHDYVILSTGSGAWGAMQHVASRLATALNAQVHDPQQGTPADLSSAPTVDELRGWHDAIVGENGLVLHIERAADTGAWQAQPGPERLVFMLHALNTATGASFARSSATQVNWWGDLRLRSGRSIRIASMQAWRGEERSLTLKGFEEDAVEIDGLAARLEEALEARFDRVVAYGCP